MASSHRHHTTTITSSPAIAENGQRFGVRGENRANKLRQSEVTEDGPRSARNKATVMKMFARMCWATALMCPLACGAPDTHESSERTVTVYDYVAGRGQFRLSPVEVAVADTGNAATDAVTALLEHRPPTGRDSAWSGYCAPGKSVRSVVMSDHLVTVNLRAYDSDEGGRRHMRPVGLWRGYSGQAARLDSPASGRHQVAGQTHGRRPGAHPVDRGG